MHPGRQPSGLRSKALTGVAVRRRAIPASALRRAVGRENSATLYGCVRLIRTDQASRRGRRQAAKPGDSRHAKQKLRLLRASRFPRVRARLQARLHPAEAQRRKHSLYRIQDLRVAALQARHRSSLLREQPGRDAMDDDRAQHTREQKQLREFQALLFRDPAQ